MSGLHPIRRGTVLRRTTPGSLEVAIVLGPPSLMPEHISRVEVTLGWIDYPPTCGLVSIELDHFRRGIWKIADDEDAITVRALFLAHARDYGPNSVAWVVTETNPGVWETPPIAMRWTETR